MVTQPTSPHEELARWRKVARLIAAVRIATMTDREVEAMNTNEWKALAMVAGVKPPSAETRRQVLLTIRAQAERMEKMQDGGGGP